MFSCGLVLGTYMISDESLKLKSQVCFSLYACARRVARSYAPFLDPLGLTYTQYVTMMVLWEEEQITIRDLCQKLYLDSGTITPVLKKLVNDGYISKSRSGEGYSESGLQFSYRQGMCA